MPDERLDNLADLALVEIHIFELTAHTGHHFEHILHAAHFRYGFDLLKEINNTRYELIIKSLSEVKHFCLIIETSSQ